MTAFRWANRNWPSFPALRSSGWSIQQLGFVSRIWPGARHARYEHSIGVFHLARLAVQQFALRSGGC
ncbi:MAG: hypothetical protein R2839_05845 [Thermomicrobiales bacterium]